MTEFRADSTELGGYSTNLGDYSAKLRDGSTQLGDYSAKLGDYSAKLAVDLTDQRFVFAAVGQKNIKLLLRHSSLAPLALAFAYQEFSLNLWGCQCGDEQPLQI